MSKRKKIQITLDEAFERMLKDLKTLGYTSVDAVKAGIRLLHKKEFPLWANKKLPRTADDGLTEMEICEEVFEGKVVEENGVRFCKFKQGNFETKVPLSAIRDQLK